MTDVEVEDGTRLFSDNASGYVSRLFKEYLQLIGIRHILTAPYHPQRCPEPVRPSQKAIRATNLGIW